MARTSGETIDTFVADNLIAGTFPPTEAFTVDLKTKGVYERGTVMSIESDGSYEVLGKGSGAASCVLADATLEDDEVAVAYRTGCFSRDALIMDDSHTLSATDENNLRQAGILLKDRI